MTAVDLPCDVCGDPVGEDLHTPHEHWCRRIPCNCHAIVCPNCCWDCRRRTDRGGGGSGMTTPAAPVTADPAPPTQRPVPAATATPAWPDRIDFDDPTMPIWVYRDYEPLEPLDDEQAAS